jgi:hypothetical protein
MHSSILICTPRFAHPPHEAGVVMSSLNVSKLSNELTRTTIGVASTRFARYRILANCHTKPTKHARTQKYDLVGPRKIDRL